MRRRPASAARSPSLSIDARRTSGSTCSGPFPPALRCRPTLCPTCRSTAAWHGKPPGRCLRPSAPVRCSGPCSSGGQLWPFSARLASSPSGVLGASGVLVARPQPALAAGCTRAAPSAAAHGASIDALRSPAWTAADLTGSVPLTDGRRLWLYGDTITSGLGPTGGAVSRSFTARNSAIVQERGCLTPLLQGSGPTAGSWIPQLGAEWSWPGDGYARDGTVWVYADRASARSALASSASRPGPSTSSRSTRRPSRSAGSTGTATPRRPCSSAPA